MITAAIKYLFLGASSQSIVCVMGHNIDEKAAGPVSKMLP